MDLSLHRNDDAYTDRQLPCIVRASSFHDRQVCWYMAAYEGRSKQIACFLCSCFSGVDLIRMVRLRTFSCYCYLSDLLLYVHYVPNHICTVHQESGRPGETGIGLGNHGHCRWSYVTPSYRLAFTLRSSSCIDHSFHCIPRYSVLRMERIQSKIHLT